MKIRPLLEVRYAGSLEADPVLYLLWKERNEIQKDNLSVVKIDDPVLSKKRAAAVARYAVRVIASEALDGIGMTDEAQKLRDLPPDVDLKHAASAAYAAKDAYDDLSPIVARGASAYAAVTTAARAADAVAVAYASSYVDAVAYVGSYVDAEVHDAVYAAANAARYASQVTNKQKRLYHLNQMIKIAADIK